jgi:LPS O-antigen subunit length determinant protein (WzzB/FepE family)
MLTEGIMAKPVNRTYSRQNLETIELLAQMIRVGRMERKMSAQEMADRAGISRPRIENADPSCSIGAVFEAAVIAGIPLFEAEPNRLQTQRAALTEKLTLLPRRTRKPKRMIHDDF